MPIRMAHGMTSGLAGAQRLLARAEERRDRRGAAAAAAGARTFAAQVGAAAQLGSASARANAIAFGAATRRRANRETLQARLAAQQSRQAHELDLQEASLLDRAAGREATADRQIRGLKYDVVRGALGRQHQQRMMDDEQAHRLQLEEIRQGGMNRRAIRGRMERFMNRLEDIPENAPAGIRRQMMQQRQALEAMAFGRDMDPGDQNQLGMFIDRAQRHQQAIQDFRAAHPQEDLEARGNFNEGVMKRFEKHRGDMPDDMAFDQAVQEERGANQRQQLLQEHDLQGARPPLSGFAKEMREAEQAGVPFEEFIRQLDESDEAVQAPPQNRQEELQRIANERRAKMGRPPIQLQGQGSPDVPQRGGTPRRPPNRGGKARYQGRFGSFGGKQYPRPATQDQYNALKVGESYISPEGLLKTKKPNTGIGRWEVFNR